MLWEENGYLFLEFRSVEVFIGFVTCEVVLDLAWSLHSSMPDIAMGCERQRSSIRHPFAPLRRTICGVLKSSRQPS